MHHWLCYFLVPKKQTFCSAVEDCMRKSYKISKKDDAKFKKSFVCFECNIKMHIKFHLSDGICVHCWCNAVKKAVNGVSK